ncbi:MAG: hypothetical protein CM1200mP10_21130 [Candidatus Neomarinimicrobiota bacterium]|nr:MAG: hypothetical protein CM1200mP10_21130 [Candidatus Neomarinimicrobiota bacterium]
MVPLGVEENSITFEICKRIISDFVLLTEDEIAAGIRNGLEDHHQLIEGSAGAAIAALMKRKTELNGKTVVIVICGGNISSNTLREVLDENRILDEIKAALPKVDLMQEIETGSALILMVK